MAPADRHPVAVLARPFAQQPQQVALAGEPVFRAHEQVAERAQKWLQLGIGSRVEHHHGHYPLKGSDLKLGSPVHSSFLLHRVTSL